MYKEEKVSTRWWQWWWLRRGEKNGRRICDFVFRNWEFTTTERAISSPVCFSNSWKLHICMTKFYYKFRYGHSHCMWSYIVPWVCLISYLFSGNSVSPFCDSKVNSAITTVIYLLKLEVEYVEGRGVIMKWGK